MPAGLQVFNADGSLQFDSSTRLTRVLGYLWAGSNGSHIDDQLWRGAPFYFIAPTSMVSIDSYANFPQVSISGNTVSWWFTNPNSEFNTGAVIYYGTY
ncbi:hypothetical protein D3C85_1700840 [compost metagenome]